MDEYMVFILAYIGMGTLAALVIAVLRRFEADVRSSPWI
jgi:hypothetical protein